MKTLLSLIIALPLGPITKAGDTNATLARTVPAHEQAFISLWRGSTNLDRSLSIFQKQAWDLDHTIGRKADAKLAITTEYSQLRQARAQVERLSVLQRQNLFRMDELIIKFPYLANVRTNLDWNALSPEQRRERTKLANPRRR